MRSRWKKPKKSFRDCFNFAWKLVEISNVVSMSNIEPLRWWAASSGFIKKTQQNYCTVLEWELMWSESCIQNIFKMYKRCASFWATTKTKKKNCIRSPAPHINVVCMRPAQLTWYFQLPQPKSKSKETSENVKWTTQIE